MHRTAATTNALVRLYRRSGLTARGLIALLAAVTTMAGAMLVLAVTSEDVVGRNGLATDDPGWLRFVTSHRTGWLVDFARAMSEVGSVGVLGLIAIAIAVVLWMRGARLALAIAPGVALGLAGACAAVGKDLVARSRPPLGIRLASESEASFPSGHATDSTALFVALALVLAVVLFQSPRIRALIVSGAMLLAGLVGASRLELGVHWPTDVIAGYALGLAVAVAVTIGAVLVTRTSPPADGADVRLRRFRTVLSTQRHSNVLNTAA
jgi:undecaprenyl-diphosphatase